MMASLAEVGIDAIGASPEEFDQTIRRDLMYLTRLMREAGVEAKP
jgi:tripartite-type tricarboxylate transporter receptor subunit TctC